MEQSHAVKKISEPVTLSEKFTNWIGSTTSIVVHTIFFVGIFVLHFFGFTTSDILLILTTVVSLEAIYLAIFIQMTVNRNTQSLEEVEEDIDEIQEDIDEIQEDVDELQEDVDEMTEEDKADMEHSKNTELLLSIIENRMQKLMEDIEALRQQQKK